MFNREHKEKEPLVEGKGAVVLRGGGGGDRKPKARKREKRGGQQVVKKGTPRLWERKI